MTSWPSRTLGLTLAALVTLAGCTEVVDSWENSDAIGGGVSQDVISLEQNFCTPQDPCKAANRHCDEEANDCTGCLDGYREDFMRDDAGVVTTSFCVPDTGGGTTSCTPAARVNCEKVNKECVGVSCGECLPGFVADESGICLPLSACYPNPCTEPLRTVCQVDALGQPVCACDLGAHEDGAGSCTTDPCIPNPCTPPFDICRPNANPLCGCADGEVILVGDCYPDPCANHECTVPGRTTCEYDEFGKVECVCDTNFVEQADGCVEAPAANAPSVGEPQGDILIDTSRQLFVDDWLVYVRTNMIRRLHPATSSTGNWVVTPDPDDGVGRARAAGSVVHVDEASLAALPAPSPFKGYPWRLYYMGYRELFTFDSQTAWVCVAVADNPAGPWFKPAIRPGAAGENCVLTVDGLVDVEVTRIQDQWTMSATREAIGSNSDPGVYVYGSTDGIVWLPKSEGAVIRLDDSVVPPAIYPRIGPRSRLVWDAWEQRFVGLVGLPSPTLGDARGIMQGAFDPALGWDLLPDAVSAPAIMGPTVTDLSQAKGYTEMTAWREGSLWLGLVLRQENACPWTGEVIAASSRDGRSWARIVDEVTQNDVVIAPSAIHGFPDASIHSLSGGPPAEANGQWHYLTGGTDQAVCVSEPASGGVVHHAGRAAGLAGLEVGPGPDGVLGDPGVAPGVVITRPMRMVDGAVGAVISVNATVDEKVLIQVEALSPSGPVLAVAEAVLTYGEHYDAVVASEPLHAFTAGRFRLRFTFLGTGELFGFRLHDPACNPNPCVEPGRTVCDSVTGQAICLCDPPGHDDGEGGCTTDPCTPDPCTGPHQVGCTVVGGAAVCGCEENWVPADGQCIPDPCLPQGGVPVCTAPGPDRCRVVEGEAICYCPEGSVESPAGCVEIDSRVFVTSLAARGDTLGGITGANNLCSTLANAAGLPGSYAAWLSSPDEDALDRFANGGPWRTWDEELQLWTKLVATDIWDLTDGTIDASINRTEFGATVQGNCLVWTGTTSDGEMSNPDGLGGTCTGWTSADEGFGLAGLCDATDELWTEWAPALCTKESRFYCLQLP